MFLVLLSLLMLVPTPLYSVTIREYTIPTPGSTPTGISVGRHNDLWFMEKDHIGHITTSGKITEIPIYTGDEYSGGSVIEIRDGSLWYIVSPNILGHVSRSGVVISMVYIKSSVYCGGSLRAGQGKSVWLALCTSIVHIHANGTLEEFHPIAHALFANIILGGRGLWFTDKINNRVGYMTLQGKLVKDYQLPDRGIKYVGPSTISYQTNGNVWYSVLERGLVGRISPSGKIIEYSVPDVTRDDPSAIGLISLASDNDGVWIGEVGSNFIGHFNNVGKYSEYSIPTSNAGPTSLVSLSGNVWFTETSGNNIGELVV